MYWKKNIREINETNVPLSVWWPPPSSLPRRCMKVSCLVHERVAPINIRFFSYWLLVKKLIKKKEFTSYFSINVSYYLNNKYEVVSYMILKKLYQREKNRRKRKKEKRKIKVPNNPEPVWSLTSSQLVTLPCPQPSPYLYKSKKMKKIII